MKEHSIYENSKSFLHKISHSDGTWTNFGKVLALDSTLHIFFLFSFLILFFTFIILPSTVKSFESIINDSIAEQFNGLKDSLDNKLSSENSATFYAFLGLNGDYIFNFLEEYYNTEDTNLVTNNYFIWIVILVIIFFLFVITILLMAPYFEKNRGSKLLHILGLNLFILTLVGVFEGLFFVFVLRSEHHVSNDIIQQYITTSFQEKFNILLDDPNHIFYKKEPMTTTVIIMICTLLGIVILTPILWFYVVPKIIRGTIGI